jgi:hypothetical protein
MFAEQMAISLAGQEGSPFFQFSHQLISSLEQAKNWSSVDNLVSVITDRESLEELVASMEPSPAKSRLTDVLFYDEGYYSKMVASLIPFLKTIGYAKPNLLSTWEGLGGEMLTPFEGEVDNPDLDGAKAIWLDNMFRATGGMPKTNSLSGFSQSGNTLQAEIAMAYFALVRCGDSALANKFIKGYRLVPNLHPDYVSKTLCYGKD